MGKGKKGKGEIERAFQAPVSRTSSSVGDILGPIASVFVQQAKSNADIINYQQQTAQAAIGQNAPLLHELDKPFLTMKGHIGRKGKRSEYKLELSILDMYAFGDSFERAYGDSQLILRNGTSMNFSTAWWDVRAPRTQVSGYQKPGQAPITKKPAAQASKTELEKFWDWFNSDWVTIG